MIGTGNHSRRRVLGGGLALAGSGLIPGCAATERPLFAADTHAADYPTVRAVEFLSDYIAERTGGRLGVRVYAGGQLGSERDTLEIAQFGGLDLLRVNLAPLNPVVPLTRVPALPFVFRSVAHMRAAMDGAPGRKILDALRDERLVGLCFYDSGARSFYNTKRPIRHPDDLAGLKIRVQNSEIMVAMVDALGANPTPMSFGEVYQGLVQGVIDGAENNWPSYQSTRHYEAAPLYSPTQHVLAPEILVMSMRRWRKLSDDDRTLIQDAARASVSVMRDLWDARVDSARRAVLSQGVSVTEIADKAPFQARMSGVYDRFVSAELRPLVEEIAAIESVDA